MKKIAMTLVMLLVFSICAFADGEYGAGGKSCPNGQTSCLVSAPEPTKEPTDDTVYEKVLVFLESIFG